MVTETAGDRLKILQVIPYFFVDWVGGKEGKPVETVYGLSKALVERGREVSVYTTDAFNKTGETPKNKTLDLKGIKVREFKSLGSRTGPINHLRVSPAMIPVMRGEAKAFNIIHLGEYPTFQNIVVHHYAKKYHIPYVLQAHGSIPKVDRGGFKWLLRCLYDILFGYRLLKDASKVIALTQTEAEQYKSMGVSEDKIEIVPNGIDLSEFDNLPQKGVFRRKYGLYNDEKMILFLARINKIKGLDLLVRAFADLTKESNDVKLVIVGPDDEYLPALKELIRELGIQEKVLLPGPLYGREKLQAYVDADVYVLPSSYEIFGITILESCACGTPVVVTDRCGIADIIDGQAGLVVPYDKDQLANAILNILSDEKKRREFSEKGGLLVREQFNWEKIAGQMEGIYQAILTNNKRQRRRHYFHSIKRSSS